MLALIYPHQPDPSWDIDIDTGISWARNSDKSWDPKRRDRHDFLESLAVLVTLTHSLPSVPRMPRHFSRMMCDLPIVTIVSWLCCILLTFSSHHRHVLCIDTLRGVLENKYQHQGIPGFPLLKLTRQISDQDYFYTCSAFFLSGCSFLGVPLMLHMFMNKSAIWNIKVGSSWKLTSKEL